MLRMVPVALCAAGLGAGLLWYAGAEAGTGSGDDGAEQRAIRLKAPSLDDWRPVRPAKAPSWSTQPSAGYDRLALPTGYFVPIFDRLEKPRRTIGRVRRGVALSVRKVEPELGCYDLGAKGHWYEIDGGGFLCSTSGYELVEQAPPLDPPQPYPATDAPMPFRYARVVKAGVPRLSRRPTLDAYEALASVGGPADDPTGLMVERMIGDFFLSLDAEEDIGGVRFYRTVHGEYVEADALKPREGPKLRGARLGRGMTLPLAFVRTETKILCDDGERPCGVAEKYARFAPGAEMNVGGAAHVEGPEGVLVPAEALRFARAKSRPGGVGPSDKWVHIDLAEQTLVAYEGERPVFATLVASGKPGHSTPTGLYRVQRKYLTKTMRAIDPNDGLYHIEDIPYTMYYYGSYAVHGAFWHDDFGDVRSHGCANLAPVDARWLYHWAAPELPEAWHAVENIERGLAIHFTDEK